MEEDHKLFEVAIPGLDTPLPMEFYFGEDFQYKQDFIQTLSTNGAFIVRDQADITPLTFQIACADNRLYLDHSENRFIRRKTLKVPVLDTEFFTEIGYNLSRLTNVSPKDIAMLYPGDLDPIIYSEKFLNGTIYSISWLKESLLRKRLQNKSKYKIVDHTYSCNERLKGNSEHFNEAEALFCIKNALWECQRLRCQRNLDSLSLHCSGRSHKDIERFLRRILFQKRDNFKGCQGPFIKLEFKGCIERFLEPYGLLICSLEHSKLLYPTQTQTRDDITERLDFRLPNIPKNRCPSDNSLQMEEISESSEESQSRSSIATLNKRDRYPDESSVNLASIVDLDSIDDD
ncbi:unnamed protein product [Moneuplotes crassus]|uniref:Uncharacterized protein n=1 Tax=Euplotes crassus TaxID=5936 RepID=A0AAD1UMR4_EUPCR|nr:unnamed protein product [Moneuplotes crassus]